MVDRYHLRLRTTRGNSAIERHPLGGNGATGSAVGCRLGAARSRHVPGGSGVAARWQRARQILFRIPEPRAASDTLAGYAAVCSISSIPAADGRLVRGRPDPPHHHRPGTTASAWRRTTSRRRCRRRNRTRPEILRGNTCREIDLRDFPEVGVIARFAAFADAPSHLRRQVRTGFSDARHRLGPRSLRRQC